MECTPNWAEKTKFFLPNEDAEIVRSALQMLPSPPVHPLFVTGSGILALDMLTSLPENAAVECIDLSSFQYDYFHRVVDAVRKSSSCTEFLRFLELEVLPEMNRYYAARGQAYTFDNVLYALKHFFRIRFLFDDTDFSAVRKGLKRIFSVKGDMADRTALNDGYDFVHLSNIVDYLSEESLYYLFENCAMVKAPVFFIRTTACLHPETVEKAFWAAGYNVYRKSVQLSEENRALGAVTPQRPWMRKGCVYLLKP